MELSYWPPEPKWGLPTIDMESLELLTYLKFTHANIKLSPCYKTWLFGRANILPSLKISSGSLLTTKQEIMAELKSKYYDPDCSFDNTLKAKVMSYKSLIEDKLIHGVQALLWLESSNYNEYTRSLYAKRCRYPTNFTYSESHRKELVDKLIVLKNIREKDKENICEKLHNEASEVLSQLDDFMSSKDHMFLFGEKPSSADAMLYSCLAILQKAPLSICKLQNVLTSKQSLCKYVNRITMEYFKEHLYQPPPSDDKSTQEDEEEDKLYDWLLPVSVTAIAMLSYAINIGMIQVNRSR